MTAIPPQLIQELRERTGAGVMDCKRALHDAGGNLDQAVTILRERGEKVAQAKQVRQTTEGHVGVYVHTNGKVAALVALSCETDFVARTEDFKALAHDLAMHVAAAQPTYLGPDDVPTEVIESERSLYRKQLRDKGKAAAMLEKIVTGKLEKFYEEVCLLKQPFIKDDSVTIEQHLTTAIARLGENIRITSFSRLAIA